MGPLATVDFLGKLIEETPARRDAEHIPVVVWSVPQIPERPMPSSTPGNRRCRPWSPASAPEGSGRQSLRRHPVQHLRITGTQRVVTKVNCPILHIADAACGQFAAHGIEIDTVGLIATSGTLVAGFFQQRLDALGYRYIASSARDQEELVLPAIRVNATTSRAHTRSPCAPRRSSR